MADEPPRPNEDEDVIVHTMRVHQPGADGFQREWWVWVGKRKNWVFASEDQALDHARALASRHDRPAWLLDSTGYPLKRITLD